MDATQKSQLDTFVWESREHLDLLEPALLRLQREPGNAELINSIFRAAHSIKGGAGFFGLSRIRELSHGLEHVMTRVREGEATVTPELLDLLLAGLDKLRIMIDDPAASEKVDISSEMERVRHAFDRNEEPATAPVLPASPEEASAFGVNLTPFHVTEEQAADVVKKSLFVYKVRFYRTPEGAPANYLAKMQSVGVVLDAVTHVPEAPDAGNMEPECEALFASVLQEDMIDIALDIPREQYEAVSVEALQAYVRSTSECPDTPPKNDAGEKTAALVPVMRPSAGGGASPPVTKAEDTVRLPVSLLDDLMNLAGELVLGRNQLLMLSDQLSDRVNGFTPALRNIDRVATGLRDKVMSTRLQPLGTLFSRFARVIRDLASELNKQIELRVDGGEVELDKSLIEVLSDPLTHLLRNCADHGIETPEAREACGKPPTGRITLSASHQGGRVFIRVSDDGRGMDGERVRRKIVEHGLARAEEVEGMSLRQVLKYVFVPGFSTAEQVTDVSGRGVGMDVVKNNVERMGGSVDLESRQGQGTCVTLCLPLTVAVAPAMIVGVRDRLFAIPQVQLEELVRLRGEVTLELIRGAPVIRLRGHLLPVVNVAKLLHIDEAFGGEVSCAAPDVPRSQYVAVIKSNQDRFGLLVDQVMDEEEIVVKPLSAYVKQCPCYSGATVLGDGRIVLILDTAGIVNYAGLQFPDDNSELQSRQEEELRRRQTETQHLLLFRNAPNDLFAVNQELISRIEKIRAADIRTSAHMEFVTYKKDALRVVRLHHYLPVDAPPQEPEYYFMLVPKLVKKPMGILCASVEDVVDVNVVLDRDRIKGPGIMGSALLRSELALFLDIYSLFETVDPELYAHSTHPQILPGKRILLAEDTLFFRTLVSQYLESLECVVDVAQDGIEALDLLNRRSYDMLVTDLEMPGMDGFELTERVRASARLREMPVVALSSISKTRYLNRALAAGVDAYESKIDKEQLRVTIERVLSGAGIPVPMELPEERTSAADLLDLDPLDMGVNPFSEEPH